MNRPASCSYFIVGMTKSARIASGSGQRCVMLFFWSLAFWISLRMLREDSR